MWYPLSAFAGRIDGGGLLLRSNELNDFLIVVMSVSGR